MKKIFFWVLLSLLAFTACDKNEEYDDIKDTIGEVSIENLPVMDCSTSTQPLTTILTSHLLKIPYTWWENQLLDGIMYARLDYSKCNISEGQKALLDKKLNCSTTHGSYTNLIEGNVDLIIASRYSSRDENELAQQKNVKLLQKPIAKDAFAFIVNSQNIVKDLTVEQIRKIYTGEITNWKEVGGNDAPINAYIRDANSGSQEKMETMVMEGLDMIKSEELITHGMSGPYFQLRFDVNGISYSPYYYYNIMAANYQNGVSAIKINGISPDNISNGSYPFISEIYTAIRADEPNNSLAHKIYDYLTTSNAAPIITESGYIPLK